MEVGIRPYRAGDAAEVVALSLRAWEPVLGSLAAVLGPTIFRRLHDDWRSDQRQAVEAVLAAEATLVWVAESGEQVVGFVAIRLDRDRRLGELAMLAVDPTYQRRGIGTRLTTFALDRMREAGMTVAMAETGGDPGHAPARHTYERSGFTPLPIARYFNAL